MHHLQQNISLCGISFIGGINRGKQEEKY